MLDPFYASNYILTLNAMFKYTLQLWRQAIWTNESESEEIENLWQASRWQLE